MVKVVYDDIHWLHQDPRGHPENPNRLEIVLNALRKRKLYDKLEFTNTLQGDNSVLLVHDKEYVSWIEKESRKGFHYIDPDTYVTRDTYRVATAFSTTTKHVVLDGIRKREVWVILPRPPGHHAGVKGRALGAPTLGFCIFNHVAVGARAALDLVERVLIIDFDAHHGNGTQEIFWDEPRVIHVDIHEYGIYPGTGWVTDIGGFNALGSKINVPVEPYTGDNVYVWVLQNIISPLIEKYKIELVMISAGFDSYIEDPLTELSATENTFYTYGYFLHKLFEEGILRSVIIVLEGGYDAGLRKGFPAFIEGLMGVKRETSIKPSPPPKKIYVELKKIMGKYHGIEI